MLVIPAIDLLGEKAVRLVQGDERRAVVYSDRPADLAGSFARAGAVWIHVVNLDAAFGRPGVNDGAVEAILRDSPVRVQLGGGIRSIERIAYWLGKGVARVVLGSAAVRNPALVRDAVRLFGAEAVVAGIDMRGGRAAVHGWREITETTAREVARSIRMLGVRRAVVTDIVRDGMLSGPDLRGPVEIAETAELNVIVSGGVSSFADLEKIRDAGCPGIEGAVVGKAVYEKKLDLREAIARLQEPADA